MSDVRQLYDRLPHSGSMCLIDEIVEWDRDSVHCRASSHRQIENPLRIADELPAICALEYAAQAFALHGLLVADEFNEKAPDESRAFVAFVNELDLHIERLDGGDGALEISGQVMFRQSGSAVYRFEIRDASGLLVNGQVGLMS
jgi:predicted hotdog family 3-hydroxylacyl-ACP dehydratase